MPLWVLDLERRVSGEDLEVAVRLENSYRVPDGGGGDEAMDQLSNGLTSAAAPPVEGSGFFVVGRFRGEERSSAYETETRRHIAAAIRGQLPLSDLNRDERLVANFELDVAIRERAAGVGFGQALLKAGLTAVALDDEGSLVEFRPDRSRHPVDASPQAERAITSG